MKRKNYTLSTHDGELWADFGDGNPWRMELVETLEDHERVTKGYDTIIEARSGGRYLIGIRMYPQRESNRVLRSYSRIIANDFQDIIGQLARKKP